jgi:hypothetical protein
MNPLELTLLQGLIDKYPTIGTHLPFLRVKDRVVTGVGMYSNFVYVETDELLPALEIDNGAISNNENIEIPGLERGLGYELCISDGKILFFEFITYGEAWDGDTSTFKLVQNDF